MTHALILAPFSGFHLDRLRQRFTVAYDNWFKTRYLYDSDQLALRLLDENTAVLVVESDFVFEEVFQRVDTLRFVGVCRNDASHVDLEAATQHGVLVVNTPSRNAMLALSRKIPAAHQYVTRGLWQNPVEPYISMRGIELAGRTLGIIGLGSIGSRLATLGKALGMNVIAYDPYVNQTVKLTKLVALDELMSHSDFVSVHVPMIAETERLLDFHRLGLMKTTAYLINTSDALVVDQ